MNHRQKTPHTSWEKVQGWYDQAVGQSGHHYHQAIIFPNLLKLWDLKKTKSPAVLDLACGQGVLARQLHPSVHYTGVDAAQSLIKAAKEYDKNEKHTYLVADITKPIKLPDATFTHASIILALQNLEFPQHAIANASRLLKPGGTLSLVINHPYFRIPRQTSWGIDEPKKIQYRRVDHYMSPLTIPIQAHPGDQKKNVDTTSYHWPLHQMTTWFSQNGLCIEKIEEWCSDKTSTGTKAKMENRARNEFPLFMLIQLKKIH